MATNYWKDGNDNWVANPSADWTTGAAPTATDDAVIDQGEPVINANVGTVQSVTDASALDIDAGGQLAAGAFVNLGTLNVDTAGSGGASLTVSGTLANIDGNIEIGSGAMTTADTVSVGGLSNSGSISLNGGTSAAATLVTQGSTAATFGPSDLLAGGVSLSGDSVLQFASGQVAGIALGGSLSISGTDAFVADAGATGSNSALDLASNAGFLTLDDGATLATAAGFTSTGEIDVSNSGNVATTTTLDVGNTTAGVEDSTGALDGRVAVSGNSLLEFTGGQIGSIGSGGSLSIDGTNAFIADAGATTSNSAVGALASNAGSLSLDDGATLATGAGFTSTGEIDVSNSGNVATTTTLDVGNTTAGVEDPTGAIDGFVAVSGNSLLEFAGGQIGSIGNFGSLSISGTDAFIADAGATGSDSALNLASNVGRLSLDDGATLATAAGFTSTGDIEVSNSSNVATTTTLDVNNTTAGVEDSTGALDGRVTVSGNALLEFTSGQIGSIGTGGTLEIDGTDAFVADAGATGSNSALNLASNAGFLTLNDSATLTTAAGFTSTSTGGIGVANAGNAATTTTLDIDNTTAGVEDSTGALDTGVAVSGNSLLEFTGGQIGSIGADGSLSLSGTDAFIADAGATTSNSAVTALVSNAGSLSLDDGATLTTAAGFTSTGGIGVSNNGDVATTTTLDVNNTTAGVEDSTGALDGRVEISGNSLLEFTGGQIGSIGEGGSLSIDGTNAFVADAGVTTSNSAVAALASNAGDLSLADGASLTTTGGLANTGTIDLNDFGFEDFGTATPPTTLLDVNSAAGLGTAQSLTGTVDLGNNAILEFAQGGQITSIADNSGLSLDGPFAFVADAGATTSNSALSGLASIGDSSQLSLSDGAAITTTGALATGTGTSINLVNGASLVTGGALSSTGSISLSGDWTVPTVLQIDSAAGFGTAQTVTAQVSVEGNSLLVFTQGGELTSIALGDALSVDGTSAFVADAGATTSNSALTGLADNAGFFSLGDGASVTTSGALTNTGTVSLSNAISQTQTSLVVTGTTAGFSDASGNLDSGIDVSGNSLLEFTQGGTFSGIAAGSSLTLDGATAFVADGGATTSDSALSGLATNEGALVLDDGASLATTGNLLNDGSLEIGSFSKTSGTTLAVNGTLTSDGNLSIGTDAPSATLSATTLALTGGSATIGPGATVAVQNVTLAGAALLDIDAPAASLTSPIGFTGGSTATLQIDAAAVPSTGGAFANTISGFSAGDFIDLTGLTYTPGTTTATLDGTTLTVTNGTATDTLTLTAPGATAGFVTTADSLGGTEIELPCFASGTLIRTSRGDVAVEALAVGDRVVTASGEHRPIVWLGHRTIDCRRHPRPLDVRPVCIAAHAFGPNRPARDLVVSPGHAICLDVMGELLIPAAALIDGRLVSQIEAEHVTYWHVELDSHDILLAEDLPCESYLEMGNRGFFADCGIVSLAALPDATVRTHADFCRPFHETGPLVDAAKCALARRAATRDAAGADMTWRASGGSRRAVR